MVKQKRDYEIKKELIALFLFKQCNYILKIRTLYKLTNKVCVNNSKIITNQISTNTTIIMGF